MINKMILFCFLNQHTPYINFQVPYKYYLRLLHRQCQINSLKRLTGAGPRFNKKTPSYRIRNPIVEIKTVVRSSYLHNRISYTGKMSSLYLIGDQLVADAYPMILMLERRNRQIYSKISLTLDHSCFIVMLSPIGNVSGLYRNDQVYSRWNLICK